VANRVRIDSLLRDSTAKIQAQTESDSARIDAELLLLSVLAKPRSYLFAYPELDLSEQQCLHYLALLNRRLGGEPIAYILGSKEFWSLDFEVTPDVLIPRPDTECLVEFILALPLKTQVDLIDLGVGSGAISIALGSEKPDWTIYGSEKNAAALHVAQSNAQRLLSDKAQSPRYLRANWLSCFAANSFDVIVSNPPYIDREDAHLAQGDVRFEPRAALVSNNQGMADIAIIANQAKQCLKAGGWLVLEHGFNQAERVVNLLLSLDYREVENFSDYAGNPRFSVGRT
jgi:release factor glutamine methyltransferase